MPGEAGEEKEALSRGEKRSPSALPALRGRTLHRLAQTRCSGPRHAACGPDQAFPSPRPSPICPRSRTKHHDSYNGGPAKNSRINTFPPSPAPRRLQSRARPPAPISMDVDVDMPAALPSPRHHSASHSSHHHRSATPADYPTFAIRNVHLPFESDDPTHADPLYNVFCVGGRVDRIELATPNGSRSVSSSSGHNSPARNAEFFSTRSASPRSAGMGVVTGLSPRGGTSHAELDAQGRGILLPASVASSLPVPSSVALMRELSMGCLTPQARARAHTSRQVLLARPVR